LIKPKKKDDSESNEKVNDNRDHDTSNTMGQSEECMPISVVVSNIDVDVDVNVDAVTVGVDCITYGNGVANDDSTTRAASIKENEMTMRENESAENNVESLGELKEKTTQNEKVNENENETVEMHQHEGELVEVNLDIPQELDSGFEKIKLQNANDVYYRMYKEAKEKAKSAKKIAVEAYLAAEEIKFTYNLIDNESDSDNSSESESDNDNESDNDGESDK
jgi:hypothetical protein